MKQFYLHIFFETAADHQFIGPASTDYPRWNQGDPVVIENKHYGFFERDLAQYDLTAPNPATIRAIKVRRA